MSLVPGNLPALANVLKQAREFYSNLEGSDKDKLDQMLRVAAKILPFPAGAQQVQGYLANGSDPLPIRLAGAFMNPEVRKMFTTGMFNLERVDPAPDGGEQVDYSNKIGWFVCPECESTHPFIPDHMRPSDA